MSTKKTNLQRHSILKCFYPLGLKFVCEFLQKHNLLAQSHTDYIIVVKKK